MKLGMNTNSVTKVTVAKTLLPAGRNVLEDVFELIEGGPDCDRGCLLELVPGSAALIADPTVPVDAEILDAAGPDLGIVANYAVGFDNIDLEACRSRGVVVTNTPDVLTDATAELAAGLRERRRLACPGCGLAEHELDATHCRRCGTALPLA